MHEIDVKTVEPNVAPSPLPTWSSRLLVGGGLAASLAAHIAVGSAVLFVSPRLFATTSEQTMAIDIVSPSEFEQASKAQQSGPDGATPEVKSPSEAGPVNSPKSPDIALPPRPAAPPQPQQQAEPQLQRPMLQSTQSVNMPAPAPPAADVVPKPEQAPELIPADPATIVDLLHLPMQMADAVPGGPPSETMAKLTPAEIAEFKAHLKKCWVPPPGIPQATKKLTVVFRIALSPDGRLMAQPDLRAATFSEYGPALRDSVAKGLAQCQPYNMLPAEKYSEWKLLDLNFSQDDVAGVSPASAKANGAPRG